MTRLKKGIYSYFLGTEPDAEIDDFLRKQLFISICLFFCFASGFLTSVSIITDGLEPRRLYGLAGALICLGSAWLIRRGYSLDIAAQAMNLILTVLLIVFTANSGGIEGFAAVLLIVPPLFTAFFVSDRGAFISPAFIVVYVWFDFFIRGSSVLNFYEVMVPTTLTCVLCVVGLISVGFAQLTRARTRLLEEKNHDLQTALERLRRLSDNVPVGIFEYAYGEDGKEQILFCNRVFEELLDVTKEQVMQEGRPAMINTLEADQKQLAESIDQAVQSKEIWQGVFRVGHDDGSVHWIEGRSAPKQTRDGHTIWYGSLTDITALKEYEKELVLARKHAEQANSSKSDFLANMSHELRTPLNSIIGYSDLMMMQLKGPLSEAYISYAGSVKKSGEILLGHIEKILHMAKLDAGALAVQPGLLELGPLLDDVCEILQVQADNNNVRLSLVHPDIPPIWADEQLVTDVLMNIIGNALKFSFGQSVDVVASVESKFVEVEIRDTGIGMDASQLATALEPFGQAHRETNLNQYSGTGLGLPLARKSMEAIGGEFRIFSEKYVGTNITLCFPRAANR